jgi:alpha-tubulin suppressor-like RCC1 family protein
VRTPSRTAGIEFAKSISAGGSQACAIGGGKVWCWGQGQHVPALVPELAGAVSVAAGEHHVCAVTDNGAVRCSGANTRGQAGNGLVGGTQAAIAAVVGLGGAVGIAAGGEHSCAITGSGEVWCWGAGSAGQLGRPKAMDSGVPAKVVGVSGAVSLALGDAHSCALLGDGSIRCWGADASGELGRPAGSTEPGALAKVVGVPPAKAISASMHHTCAVSQAGEVWCWGFNGDGQLGGTPGRDRVPPGQVAGVEGVIAVTAGAWHACALLAGGKLRCWGDNAYGQLGNGGLDDSPIPTVVPGLTDITAADAGGGHQCAIRADGSVWCWGLNVAGSVGDGSAFSAKPLLVADLP